MKLKEMFLFCSMGVITKFLWKMLRKFISFIFSQSKNPAKLWVVILPDSKIFLVF